jgi:hypothetical protein
MRPAHVNASHECKYVQRAIQATAPAHSQKQVLAALAVLDPSSSAAAAAAAATQAASSGAAAGRSAALAATVASSASSYAPVKRELRGVQLNMDGLLGVRSNEDQYIRALLSAEGVTSVTIDRVRGAEAPGRPGAARRCVPTS